MPEALGLSYVVGQANTRDERLSGCNIWGLNSRCAFSTAPSAINHQYSPLHFWCLQRPLRLFCTQRYASHAFRGNISRNMLSSLHSQRSGKPLSLLCIQRHYASHALREKKSRNMLLYLTALVFAMVGCSYAAVPLYRRFCQATGYGGTVQRREVRARVWFDILFSI